jgi:hypothetical protein
MSQWTFIRRVSASGVSCALALALCATSAAAKENKRAICTAAGGAYKQAVSENKAGHWRDARTSLATCVEATPCGGIVPKCKALLDKLEAKMSSVVPVVTDESGAPRLDVQVEVDGQLLASHLDGMAQLIEPGPHEFTFSADQGVFATRKVLILEGQRDRPITVTITGQTPSAVAADATASPSRPSKAPPAAKPAADESNKTTPEKATGNGEWQAGMPRSRAASDGDWAMPRSVFPYVLGGVGLAGLAAGGFLTVWGNNDNSALERTCRPNCQPASQDHVKTMYIAADISLGAGAAALAVTTFLIATSRSTESAAKPTAHEALLVGVQPTRSGAFASVSGAF